MEDFIERSPLETPLGEAFRTFINTAYLCARAASSTPPPNLSRGAFFNDVEELKDALLSAQTEYARQMDFPDPSNPEQTKIALNSTLLVVIAHLLEIAALSPATLAGRDIFLRNFLLDFRNCLLGYNVEDKSD